MRSIVQEFHIHWLGIVLGAVKLEVA